MLITMIPLTVITFINFLNDSYIFNSIDRQFNFIEYLNFLNYFIDASFHFTDLLRVNGLSMCSSTDLNPRPGYGAVIELAETIELPDDFFESMTELQYAKAKDFENALRLGASTDDEFIESKMFFRMQKAYQILHPKTEGEELIDNFMNMGFEDCVTHKINHTNKINVRGEIVDVSGWNRTQVMKFLQPLDQREANDLYHTEHVHSLFNVATPTVKLYYPEPYIAAPSKIHTDLWFLHILHYQFWLWFFFIFLVVLFFIVFIVTVRWCQENHRPRRETRGVSRSKCGDLITACVPVTWAASIIISESTDATDITDGFSTGELVVGVRAYQWGWEYYYPKTIDLNYNVKPSYASFIGNSIKYSTTTNTVNDASNFWRHYQKKTLDSAVTPAHLLMLPFDNANVANLFNFNDAGINTLKQSASFAKIRANSKLFNTNVILNADHYILKYNKISNLAFNDNIYTETLNYGNVRQHNLTASAATSNILNTFLNDVELNQFLTTGTIEQKNPTNDNLNFKNINTDFETNLNIKTSAVYPTFFDNLNDSSDSKKSNHLINSFISKKTNNSSNNLFSNNTSSLVNLPASVLANWNTSTNLNTNFTNIRTMLKGENTNILAADQLIINYANLPTNNSNYNLSTSNNVIAAMIKKNSNLTATTNTFTTVTSNPSFTIDSDSFLKLWARRNSFSYPHPVIYSNNPFVNINEYDTNRQITKVLTLKKNTSKLENSVQPTSTNLVISGDQTNAVVGLTTAYWRMFWSATDQTNRTNSNFKFLTEENNFYLPVFTNYYDYDFRNAQAFELLEDAFWESSNSSYTFYDYINLTRGIIKDQSTSKLDSIFNPSFFLMNNNLINTNKSLLQATYKDVSVIGQLYTNSIEVDDFTTQSNLATSKNYFIFPNTDLFFNADDMTTLYKNLQQFNNLTLSNLISLSNLFYVHSSYLSTFNNFRADFEDFNFNITDSVRNIFDNNLLQPTSNFKNTQLSNPITIRSNVKNSIVNFNALRKVFRARFDEGRSHTSLQLFANSYLNQPFINDTAINYTQLLSKDTNSFYQNVLYKNTNFKIWNPGFAHNITQNYNFYDIPFLLSEGSDLQKFMWFDWWAQWGMYEVQPSSVAKYSTLGVPYSRKHFDFGAGQGDNLQDVETYFTRIARLRKNYLSNWLYSPFLYNRLLNVNLFTTLEFSNLLTTKLMLKNMYWYNTLINYKDSTKWNFAPSISGMNIYNKTNWRPFAGIQSYYYKNSQLLDILTRREYLYRKYLLNHKSLINLPSFFTANVNNKLIDEIKSSFLLSDPITYSSEHSREFFYHSLPFFKFLIFKTLISDLVAQNRPLPINTSLITDYLFFYALNNDTTKINTNELLYKDQHRPLKKNITSMLRLHGTGAIAMPVDVRLQILASSRDVIHSWAIPSAGIKIDCVPGYTSHRIMTFSLTGIYWGQCMEICGRYHHWMPIIVYFIKRDLFFLWCTHFVFKTSKTSNLKITDKQFANYIRLISYDKASWLNELRY